MAIVELYGPFHVPPTPTLMPGNEQALFTEAARSLANTGGPVMQRLKAVFQGRKITLGLW